MKKSILSFVLVLSVLLSVVVMPATVSAAASGTCGDNLTWTLDDNGTLIISGTGGMYNWTQSKTAPWRSSRSKIKSVVIGDSVTTIGDYAFYDCSSLTSVEIGDSVTTIGDYAFYYCSSLTSVEIGDSVTTIGNSAFYRCESLTSINVDENNDNYCSIDGNLFDKNKTTIIQYAIGKTNSSYTIPDSVTTIGDYAFSGCRKLTSIEIPDSVTTIGDYAFYGCSSLTSVEIGDSVTTIGNSAFYYCDGLTSINVDENNDNYCSIDGNLFDKNKTTIIQYAIGKTNSSYTIPDSVTTIGDYAFSECRKLTSIEIPDSVTAIGDYAFYDCSSLTSVEIGDSVTTIGDYAFYYCSSLTSVEIGDSVTTIGKFAFSGCRKLTSIEIPDSVTTIGDYAFSNCYSLTSVEIGDSVTTIGERAFYGCSSLTSVEIGDSVTTIGEYAFSSCYSLTSVVIGDSVTTIGNYAFSGCESLTSVVIGDSVTTIGYRAFSDCFSLTSIEIPDSVTTIGNYAFSDCFSLTSIEIPDSVTTIGNSAFLNCKSLTDVYYTGTEERWKKISIKSGNSYLTNATIHYNSRMPKGVKLSSSTITATPGTCQSIFVYKSDGVTKYGKNIKATSDNKKVVTTVRNGNEIILDFHSTGNATITIEATDSSGHIAYCNVSVNKPVNQEERYLLERFALCQVVYSCAERNSNNLITGKTIGNQDANKSGKFLYPQNGSIVLNKELYKYINNYTVIRTPDNPQMGFYAAAFQSPEGDIIIAYRGSEGEHGFWGSFMFWDKSEVDWWGADLHMFLGIKTSQFTQALTFYDTVKKENPGRKITLTGHSLGGALSSYVALNRKVKTDNINGATGLIYNKNLLNDDENYPVNYEGFDIYVNENFSGHNDLQNNVVTRSKNLGEFNYNEYADSTTKNRQNDFNYHSISSVMDYINGSIVLTEKINEHIAQPDILYGVRYIGTSKNNTYIAPISKKNYAENLPGSNQSKYKELPVAPPNYYILAGAGDDNITIPEGGHDTLIGNSGNDTLNGGAGNDKYIYGGDFGKDTIIDPSGNDKIIFTDRLLSELTISGNNITCGSNSIQISTQAKRTANFTVVDKDEKTQTIQFPKINTYSLRRSINAATTKGIKVLGNATVEIYGADEEMLDIFTIDAQTEEGIEYKDYGMAVFAPQSVGLTLPAEGYIVKIKSDEAVSIWAVSDADNPTVAKQTFVENQDLSDGSVVVINTGEFSEEQLSVKLVNEGDEKGIYSEVPEKFNINADKTDIKKGETITMSVPEIFADSVVWECSNNNAYITKNEDLSVSVVGYKEGTETIRAYLPNDELYSAEFSFEITEDAAPSVIVSSKEETYDGSEIATDSVTFDVSPVEGYDKVVFSTSSPYSQVEDTNIFVINTTGNHKVDIYCENSETGAKTKAFTFEFSQDGEAPQITGVEDDCVYYIDRIIEIYDNSLDTVYINDELSQQDTFTISQPGAYNIIATDKAGNKTEISFEIEEIPSCENVNHASKPLISNIRDEFERIKYSLSEDKMSEIEEQLSKLEEIIANVVEIVTLNAEKNDKTAEVSVVVENILADEFVYVASYDSLGIMKEIKRITLKDNAAKETFSAVGVSKYKAFVWDINFAPLTKPKEYTLN